MHATALALSALALASSASAFAPTAAPSLLQRQHVAKMSLRPSLLSVAKGPRVLSRNGLAAANMATDKVRAEYIWIGGRGGCGDFPVLFFAPARRARPCAARSASAGPQHVWTHC
jgi:hypothetical protein